MKQIVADIVFPNTIKADISISTQESVFAFEKNSECEIIGANVSISLNAEMLINGVPVNFDSKISHTLTSDELKCIIEKR